VTPKAILSALLFVAAFMLASPGGANAQASGISPNTTLEGLTVVAPSEPDAKRLPSIVFKFVQSHGAPGRIDQLTRWGSPPCPTTAGLPEDFNTFVSKRVVEVASQVGAPTNKKPACKMNLLIIFTDQPQALLDKVRRQRPQLLGFHYAAQAKRLATINRPIQAWYVTGTKSSRPSPNNDLGGLVKLDDPFEPMAGGSPGSRLTSHVSSEFLAALVVVDTTKTAGQKIGAIADHVAVLSLTRPSQPRPCGELPSILDVMNPDCSSDRGVDAITPWDLAYLKALYRVDSEEYLPMQQGRIVGRMVRDAKERQPASDQPR
jgi:hypothetical protein